MPFQPRWHLQTDAIVALIAVLAGVAVVAVAVLVHVGPFAAAAPVAGQTGVVVGAVFVVVTLEALRAVGAREVTPVVAAALLTDRLQDFNTVLKITDVKARQLQLYVSEMTRAVLQFFMASLAPMLWV